MKQRANKVQRTIAASLGRLGYTGKDFLLVVAVSGGPDSVALLHALVNLQKPLSLRLHVAHLNHNFREEAEEDARFVAQMAQSLALPFTVQKADPITYQKEHRISSFEEAARQVRYHFLAEVARTNKAVAVVLGHTADDQAETVLMHLLRGSGVPGLAGMKELATLGSPLDEKGLTVLRPLLEVTKEKIREYCQLRGISFRDDPANLSMRFTRNRIRHLLLPALKEYNPRIGEALVRLAGNVSLEQDFLEVELAKVWSSVTCIKEEQVVLNRQVLATLHPLIQSLVLRRAYQELVGDTRRLHQAHLKAMMGHIGAPPGKLLELPRGLRLLSTYTELLLGHNPHYPCPYPSLIGQHSLLLPSSSSHAPDERKTTEFPGWSVSIRAMSSPPESLGDDPFTGWFDASALRDGAWVRTRLPGDRFLPAGMDGEKKLQDFMVNAKVPQHWRDHIPLLTCQSGIAWMVGYRIAEWARFKDDGRKGLEISFHLAV